MHYFNNKATTALGIRKIFTLPLIFRSKLKFKSSFSNKRQSESYIAYRVTSVQNAVDEDVA